ncbi:uncharacterized protein LOC141665686 [Apium graveolens]|uniref:uncharacterized protein LOC141665686 n=1 Tax=Apium graveolens TaxID=4045 RepID=UPI003D7A1EB9
MANVKYLCEVFGDRIRKNPQWSCKEMAETIKNELEIEVPRIKVLRLRKMALEGIAESLRQHYARVRDFGQEVLLSNPKNTVKISTTRLNPEDPVKFKRIYVCYYALKAGWKAGCRPVIGLDGCFLKTVCGGQLLSAVGRDGNNQMFPICYAVVEYENTDSWRWFLMLLKDDLDLEDGAGLTIISDQQKGLENAVKELLPYVEQRLCTRHLCANFKKKFNTGILKNLFWRIALSTYKVAHLRAMKELERHSKAAHALLSKHDPKQWCKSHFQTHSLVDNTDNNMSESFNSWIINERFMPLLTMLQEIHFKLLTRIRRRRDEMLNSDLILCPKIKKTLDLSWDGDRKFQVKCGTKAVTVDLERGTCDCRMYDLTGIPCQHAIAAIHSRRHQPQEYVSDYYKREKYLESYKHSLEAMKGEEYWDFHSEETMLPPDIPKKLRGRPKKMRRREEWEGGIRSQATPSQGIVLQRYSNRRVMHCSNYRQPGHRVSKCPTKNTDATPEQIKEKDAATETRKKKDTQGSKHPKGKKDIYKGKGKQLVEEDEGSLDDDSDASDRVAEEVWKLFKDDYFQGNEGIQKKMKLVIEVEAQEDA